MKQNLGINSQFNIHLALDTSWHENTTCLKIRDFIEENKYPVIKKLDSNYLHRLQINKVTLIIAAIYNDQVSHVNFLDDFLYNIAMHKREYVFAYLDAREDAYLLNFFNLLPEMVPKIIIYNFKKGKYYIDKDSNFMDENTMEILKNLVNKLDNDDIKWTTGYILEDFLSNLGVNVSRNSLLIIVMLCFTIILISGLISCFSTTEKYFVTIEKKNR